MLPTEVLDRYGIGPVTDAREWGGTAGRTFRVATGKAVYFLRRRGARTSSEQRVTFDHGLRRALQARGVPTAAPLASLDGQDWIGTPEGVYELYPFVEGRRHRAGDRRELASVARTLAAYHEASLDYRARVAEPPFIEQFILAAPGSPGSTRIDDPASMRKAIEILSGRLNAGQADTARRMHALLAEIERHYGGEAYRKLDRHVVHGDFHADNLLFGEDGEVVGVFDFDWAVFSPRIRDVADALHFFAGSPTRQGSDIWALTAARRVSEDLAALLLREYDRALPFAEEEIEAIRWAWLARWVASHIEGTAKVPETDRGSFLTREVNEGAEAILRFDARRLLRGG